MIYSKMDTANYFLQDVAAQVAIIRKRIKEVIIDIEVELTREYPKVLPSFQEDLVPYLIIKYNKEAQKLQIEVKIEIKIIT